MTVEETDPSEALRSHIDDCEACSAGLLCDEVEALFVAAESRPSVLEPLPITPISTHLDSLTTQGVTDDC